jgi:murein DD-endopeptidase MepM/ murein hydrolase activator NlpD
LGAADEAGFSRSLIIKSGDTMLTLLEHSGLSTREAYRTLAALKGRINPATLRPGDRLIVTYVSDEDPRQLAGLRLEPRNGDPIDIALRASSDDRALGALPARATKGLTSVTVEAGPGLSRSLIESGLPAAVSEQVVMVLSKNGKLPSHGETLNIAYRSGAPSGAGAQLASVGYRSRDGRSHSLRYAALPMPAQLQSVGLEPAIAEDLSDPLPGARISSPFGWRVHPVFHKLRFHKGVDYEAAEGTPVRAAADGIVEEADDHGNYGNYIRIVHSSRIATAYAHLEDFAPGLEPGDKVKRGQVIGYVGTTGVATGPHLYYEVLVDDRQVDPESPLLQAARRTRTQLAGFHGVP